MAYSYEIIAGSPKDEGEWSSTHIERINAAYYIRHQIRITGSTSWRVRLYKSEVDAYLAIAEPTAADWHALVSAAIARNWGYSEDECH